MNPIEQKIKQLDPSYEITQKQALYIKNSTDPAGVAGALPEQVENNRVSIAEGLGIDVSFVSVGDGLSASHLKSAVTAQRSSDPLHVARMVSPDRLVNIGRRLEKRLTGPFVDLYREILKREPDAAGLEFYERKYAEGTELWVIAQDITESEEATS